LEVIKNGRGYQPYFIAATPEPHPDTEIPAWMHFTVRCLQSCLSWRDRIPTTTSCRRPTCLA